MSKKVKIHGTMTLEDLKQLAKDIEETEKEENISEEEQIKQVNRFIKAIIELTKSVYCCEELLDEYEKHLLNSSFDRKVSFVLSTEIALADFLEDIVLLADEFKSLSLDKRKVNEKKEPKKS